MNKFMGWSHFLAFSASALACGYAGARGDWGFAFAFLVLAIGNGSFAYARLCVTNE